MIPLPSVFIDTFCQFANSVAGPLALIHVGVNVAPTRKITVSVVLATLFALASVWVGAMSSIGREFSLRAVWYWFCLLVGILTVWVYCAIFRDTADVNKKANQPPT